MVSIYKRWNKQKMVWKPRLHYKLEAQWKRYKEFISENPEKQVGGRIVNEDKFFKPSLSWSRISSDKFSVRYYPSGFIFSDASNGAFPPVHIHENILAFLNSKACGEYLEFLSPTVNYQSGEISRLPISDELIIDENIKNLTREIIGITKSDWDSQKYHGNSQKTAY
ncbi:Uncharacterised protein [Klebsiella michiganensis]|uniref:Uncharacterized protein n=1 Tax=Klebsiella michiganensis TaxID=1134687 RepID=A0A7H4M152_9ENTR|nr:Uncharacterised protein [Klebsiella michiganensis]